jgi:CRP/FNR family transcriptional regulator, anaerobic regulatory protein
MEALINNNDCQHCRLAGICLPCGLAGEEVAQIEKVVTHKRPLKAEEYVYRQADKAGNIYVVKSGSFRSLILGTDGGEQTVNFYLPGEVMGLDALQKGHYRSSTAALETSTVCELPVARLNDLCIKIPKLQTQLMRIIGGQIASHQDRIELLGQPTASARIGAFLLMLSRRYSDLGYSKTEFNLSMDRHDIASFLSLTVETVSRQLTALKNSGIIAVKLRNIQIKDMDMLKAVV